MKMFNVMLSYINIQDRKKPMSLCVDDQQTNEFANIAISYGTFHKRFQNHHTDCDIAIVLHK